MKGAFLAIYEKIKASIQHAINDDAEDWSIMPSDVAKEIDGGFKAYAEGLEEQVETLQAEQSAFMQTQAQTLAEHVFDETQHLTQAQVNEIAKIEGKVDKTDFKDHLEDDERHLTFSDRVEIDSVKDKASAEDLQRHISNPDVHYPIEITQEYTDVAIDKAKAELLEVIVQGGGGSASVDLSGVIDRISDVEGALTAHKNDPSVHFKIEETKAYTDAKLQEAKVYTDTEVAKIQGAVGGSEGVFLCEDNSLGTMIGEISVKDMCYVGNDYIVYINNSLFMFLKNINDTSLGVQICQRKASALFYVGKNEIVYANYDDGDKLYRKQLNNSNDGIAINTAKSGKGCLASDDIIYYVNIDDNRKLYSKYLRDTTNSNGNVAVAISTRTPMYIGYNRVSYIDYNTDKLCVKKIGLIADGEQLPFTFGAYQAINRKLFIYLIPSYGHINMVDISDGASVGLSVLRNGYSKSTHLCFVGRNRLVYTAIVNGITQMYLKNINTYI